MLVKVLLHISSEGQRMRLENRLADPEKHWKFTPDDLTDRARWTEYMDAYQRVLDRTSTRLAPWHVGPADRRWSARLTVQGLLRGIEPQWPAADFDVEEARLRLARS